MEMPLFNEDTKDSPSIPDIPCPVDDFTDEDGPLMCEIMEFWESSREWLRLRGLHLYTTKEHGMDYIWNTPLLSAEPTSLPYAYCIRDSNRESVSKTIDAMPRIACAQDTVGRDIILKLVNNDTPQYRIFQKLLQQSTLFTNPHTFPCVLPPISIIDTPHKYSIVTMPLWGTPLYFTDMQNVRQVLTFIRCLLEGLTFLHANRIAHRDICDFNMVVSCYRPDRDMYQFQHDLRDFRRGDDVLYAFMDYDQSIQLPLDVSVKDCRRPSREALMGWHLYKPQDTWLGESLYNPYAFDVGTLGNLFRVHLFEVVPMVPALAALFDGMTTHAVSRRFSAEEALDFFRSNIASPAQEVLDTPVTLQTEYDTVFHPELYWSKLAPPVQAHWSRFRTPPLPYWWHFLNWFMDIPGCARIVKFVWRLFGI